MSPRMVDGEDSGSGYGRCEGGGGDRLRSVEGMSSTPVRETVRKIERESARWWWQWRWWRTPSERFKSKRDRLFKNKNKKEKRV
ncbi:hypothetical protein HYC85_020527 [Camellia sinensis]|uniref:Uncharacterized protein n=1 Tax=Camellia sinensis TaxID=4442 RepID=A0A7J7GRS1_CAMSI|nr:hypothetical protein HYC85_020527 [Camellia sinensis]